MKKIYIVLTYTGTFLSRIVNIYTRKKYSHVSISLDENLNYMYSFGRLDAYNPFIGGFVHESTKYGTFKRFKNTVTKIYSLEVSETTYNRIIKTIKKIENDKDTYKFNLIGLFAVALNLRIKRKKCFYCAEFVKYVLDSSNLNLNLPDIIKPEDFDKINGASLVYSGKLMEF